MSTLSPVLETGASARARSKTILATDFQSLSIFRIVFAVYLFADYLISIRPYYQDFYGADGVMPLAALVTDASLWAPTIMARALEAIGVHHVLPYLYPVALFTFATGYRTRLSNFFVFVFVSYLFWRNIYIGSGAEDLSRLLLLWCLFLPMNRYWSVDAALDPQPRDRPYPVLPFLALRLQICSVYVFAAFFKLVGPAWFDGSAIGLALRDNMFGATATGLYLTTHYPGLLTFVTWATIAFQFALPFLIYSPWYNDFTRAAGLAGSAAMHLSFIFCLNIGGFPYVCLAMLILLVPDEWWNRLLCRRRERLARVTIFYDPDCGFCQRVSLLLREFLLAETSAVQPANADPEALRLLRQHDSWVVRGADGAIYLKWRAMAYVLRQNALFAPLGWLTDLAFLRAAMTRIYDWIGANRHRLGPLARRLMPFRSEAAAGQPALVLCGVLLWLALLCNISTVPWSALGWPPRDVRTNPIHPIYDLLQVGQLWNLFAPRPIHLQRHFRVRAELASGATVDLMERLPVAPVRPSADGYGNEFPVHRWMKYFDRLTDLTEEELAAFGRFLCRKGEGSIGPLRRVEIASFKQTPDERWTPEVAPIHVRAYPCEAGSAAKRAALPG